jgi:HD superfamily phosphohydrolase
MRQIISSEIDADRMDYLLRDSFFCGVNYGKFDAEWLIDNLVAVEKHQQFFLGLKARAIFAFEDFLLSRYHMFASVYLHHTPVIMEKMLERFFLESPESFLLPADIDRYIALDDADLWQALKMSNNRWARRIVERRPYLMLEESFGERNPLNFDQAIEALKQGGIDVISSRSKSVLSTYHNKKKHPVFVLTTQEVAVPLEEFSQLFARYQTPAELVRIFVDASDRDRAKAIIKDVFENNSRADCAIG